MILKWVGHKLEECFRLIGRIIGEPDENGLEPHKVQSTISINEARRLVKALIKPLVDILIRIEEHVRLLDQKKEEIIYNGNSINSIKEKLYAHRMELKMMRLPKPTTICAHEECSEKYQVHGMTKYSNKRVCQSDD